MLDRRAFIAAGLAAGAVAGPAAADNLRYERTAAMSQARGGAALIILRHGVTWAEHGAVDSPRNIGAATSCFLPALVSALARDHLLSLDEPAAMTLGDWGAHPVKSRITLRMLLNRTCGISANGRALSAFDALNLEPIAEPGERFIPDAAATRIFVEIARRKLAASGRPADPSVYLSERALNRVGAGPIAWRREDDGEASFTDGATLSARAWSRWGELMRRVGVWRASSLLDGDVLRDACRGSWVQPRYGFGLWLAWPAQADAPLLPGCDLWSARAAPPADLVMAASTNGDRLFVLPTQRLVVVRLATRDDDWSDAEFIATLLSET